MTTIEQLPEINRLAATHDKVRARLAEVRAGAQVTLQVVLGDGQGHGLNLTQAQADAVLLQILERVRKELRELGVHTPDPPAIVVPDQPANGYRIVA